MGWFGRKKDPKITVDGREIKQLPGGPQALGPTQPQQPARKLTTAQIAAQMLGQPISEDDPRIGYALEPASGVANAPVDPAVGAKRRLEDAFYMVKIPGAGENLSLVLLNYPVHGGAVSTPRRITVSSAVYEDVVCDPHPEWRLDTLFDTLRLPVAGLEKYLHGYNPLMLNVKYDHDNHKRTDKNEWYALLKPFDVTQIARAIRPTKPGPKH